MYNSSKCHYLLKKEIDILSYCTTRNKPLQYLFSIGAMINIFDTYLSFCSEQYALVIVPNLCVHENNNKVWEDVFIISVITKTLHTFVYKKGQVREIYQGYKIIMQKYKVKFYLCFKISIFLFNVIFDDSSAKTLLRIIQNLCIHINDTLLIKKNTFDLKCAGQVFRKP